MAPPKEAINGAASAYFRANDFPPLPAKRSGSPGLLSDAPRKRFRCEPCEKGFTTKRALLRHNRENERHQRDFQPDFYQCANCLASFSRAHDRDRHHREQHGSGKTPCVICGKYVRPNAPHKNTSGHDCRVRHDSVNESDIASTDETSGVEKAGDTADISEKFRLLSIETPVPECALKHSRTQATGAKPLPCGICHKEFEVLDPRALAEHLNGHFAHLADAKHRCEPCQISFTHMSDLQRHQQSAAAGDCGFKFAHRSTCTGHHAPSKMYKYDPESDQDRFDFSYRLLHWEQSQLAAFHSSLDNLFNAHFGPTCRLSDCQGCQRCRAKQSRYRFDDDVWEMTAGTGQSLPNAFDASQLHRATFKLCKCLQSIAEGSLPRSRSCGPFRSFNVVRTEREPRAQAACVAFEAAKDSFLGAVSSMHHWDYVLLRAAAAGDHDLLSVALSNGANTSIVDACRRTALQYAATGGSSDLVRMLLAHGADPNVAADAWSSPLSLAITMRGRNQERDTTSVISTPDPRRRKAYLETITILLENGAEPRTWNGDYPHGDLFTAMRNDDGEVIDLLVRFATQGSSFSSSDLSFAIYTRNHEVSRMLVRLGVPVEDSHIVSALYNENRLEIITLLLESRSSCSVGITARWNDSASILATELRRWDVTEFLLHFNSNAREHRSCSLDDTSSAEPTGNCSLAIEVAVQEAKIAEKMRYGFPGPTLSATCDWARELITQTHENFDMTASRQSIYAEIPHTAPRGHAWLCEAAHDGDTEAILLLLRKGTDANAKCIVERQVPLERAIRRQQPLAVQILLRFGASVAVAGSSGHNLFCLARSTEDERHQGYQGRSNSNDSDMDRVRQLLLDAGAGELACDLCSL